MENPFKLLHHPRNNSAEGLSCSTTMGIWNALFCFLMVIRVAPGEVPAQEWQVPKQMLPHPQHVLVDQHSSLEAAATFDFAVVCLEPGLATKRIHDAAERWLTRLPQGGNIANTTGKGSCCRQIQGNDKAVCILLRYGISPNFLGDKHEVKGAYSLKIDKESVEIMSTNEDGAFYAFASTLLQVPQCMTYVRGLGLGQTRQARMFTCNLVKKNSYLCVKCFFL
jgi:hypothetical protein